MLLSDYPSNAHIYIREAALLLDRRMGTLRKWEQLGILPKHLIPQRGQKGWRYWTPKQIEGIELWIRETNRKPGKGLPHYNPTQKELNEVYKKMRKPRKRYMGKLRETNE